ncbi:MAG: hypothetical protein JO352_11720, partial [Chloroflexi bacterium]|nr:hypothetical protein [Chloroflexota bacterium]
MSRSDLDVVVAGARAAIEDRDTAALVPDGRLCVVDRFPSPAGLELRTFLARNGLTFEWVDLDADPLARFFLGAGEVAADEREARL